MTQRCNPEFDKVYIGQISQNCDVDRVGAERRRVLLQAQLAQPRFQFFGHWQCPLAVAGRLSHTQPPGEWERTWLYRPKSTKNTQNVRFGSRLCENAAVAAQWKVGAGAGFRFGVRDRWTSQARIASISDCGQSKATTRFRL